MFAYNLILRYNICMQLKIQKYNFNGFTLAEVLITLGIIGVVAAISIPALMKNTEDKENKTAWKKIYSELNQATKLIANDSGGRLDGSFGTTLNSDNYRDVYIAYLKNVKLCDKNQGTSCWSSTANLNTPNVHDWYCNWSGGRSTAIMPSGAILCFGHTKVDCSDINAGQTTGCGIIYIDVNGLKAPNTWGKDVYCALTNIDGNFTPCGAPGTYAGNPINLQGCKSTEMGAACSAEYLYK